ncbi:MAG: DUF928 domain-containing protein [Lyngbya sp. HA4199-MV5]|nr:DUF928 domain-containing protein [Lyngbya sp. HA4199-MV5]
MALALGVAIAPDTTSASQLQPSSLALTTPYTPHPTPQFKPIQLAQSNPPPPPTNPGSSSAGGRRDPSNCPQDEGIATTRSLLTALSPTAKPGFTSAERPTFLVYVPKTSAKNAEFSLRNRMGQGVYRTVVALTNTPDLLRITLPTQSPPLEVGKPYTWSLAVICNPNDRLDDRFVTGMVQRIALDATRLRQIQQASPREQVALYQKADVWYDAIAVLDQLKRSQRNDPGINTTWRELLQSGGVDAINDGEAGGR